MKSSIISSFTTNGVMYASNTSALALATGISGQLFQIAANGVPIFGALNGGTF